MFGRSLRMTHICHRTAWSNLCSGLTGISFRIHKRADRINQYYEHLWECLSRCWGSRTSISRASVGRPTFRARLWLLGSRNPQWSPTFPLQTCRVAIPRFLTFWFTSQQLGMSCSARFFPIIYCLAWNNHLHLSNCIFQSFLRTNQVASSSISCCDVLMLSWDIPWVIWK